MNEDWIGCKLGEILQIERGGSPRPIKEYITNDENAINWIKISDATNSGKFILKTHQKIKPSGLKNSREVFPGDLLLSNSMSFGRPYIMGINGAIHDGWLVIRDNKFIDKDYLYFILGSPSTFNQFSKNAKGSTVKNLNIDIVSNVNIKVFPLLLQKAIVRKIEELFSSLDSGIADLKKAQEQLVIYRQAVLKKAFEGEYSNKNYKIVRVNSLCEVVRGGSPRPAGDDRFYNGNIPFMKVRDLSRNVGAFVNNAEYSIKEAGLNRTRLVKANTLLLTNSGATLGIPGITNIDTTFNDGIAAFLNLDDNLLYHYYYWISKTEYLRNLNQGAAQPNLNTAIIGNMEIPIYEDKKQHSKIVQEIESRLSVCDKVEESIAESLEIAKALRQSILKKAFEGKLLSAAEIAKCKKDKDYEPAAVLLERIKKERK